MRAACTPIRCGGGSQRAEADPARWDIPWVGLHPLSRVKEVAQFDLENDSLCEPIQEILEREIREAVSDRSGGVRSRSSRCIRSSTLVRTDSDWESPASGRSGQVGGWLLRTVQLSSSASATMTASG